MEKIYNHQLVEKNKNKKWIDKKYFSTHDKNKIPFSVILPPPNVTGQLHLGHAWDGFIQDAVIRYKKLKNFDVLFLPSMDHAGIATQAKVEEHLRKNSITKEMLGREKFINESMAWKNEYSNIIKNQWSKLGLALDYDSERFTLDVESNNAVNKVFIDLYNKNYIYRGIKAINWDPKLQTALSTIEVISTPSKSKMYYVKYYMENKIDFIEIATTRIETIFSDVAIAFHPKDKIKLSFKNQKVFNPLTQELLPIITDEYIDPKFGSGFMKVSAHAIADVEIIQKNNLKINECINKDGLMNQLAMEFCGMTRSEARIKIEEKLNNNKLLIKVIDIENNISISERSNEVIEILVMPQWFVKMDVLSKNLLNKMSSKEKVNIYPIRFEKILKLWMEEVYDWTISRQLWWGHQIPAWYKGEEIKVQLKSPGKDWQRDEDVLDTWFSSALCPFSFLGWPNNEENVKRYFPTSLLVTGYDIIFFWVARMYFQSIEFMNNIPFKDLLIHGLIRDESGKKMSKSLGNGINPIDVIEEFGSDSLRWFLLTNSTPGQDINYNRKKIESAWSLNNKLWNITRFIMSMEEENKDSLEDTDKWILSKFHTLEKEIDKLMNKYDFSLIGKILNNFIYNDFSSWYIEFLKITPNKKVAVEILSKLLILLHPFLPFVTDHLFKILTKRELLENLITTTKNYNMKYIDRVVLIISLIREFRAEFNISAKEKVYYYFEKYDDNFASVKLINKIANSEIEHNNQSPYSKDGQTIYIKLTPKLIEIEKLRLEKEINILEKEIKRSKQILSNDKFLDSAPKNKVDLENKKFLDYQNQLKLYTKKIGEL
ncbi:MAG: valine--tRNA ligase [Mycoplasmataceae bacterium]|nr:valine--tRNA ligase [Mycoplasmataceae bacterium]